MPEISWYFKLFNSIKEEHEIIFARLELGSLFGNVLPVKNFSDIIDNVPFSKFRSDDIRIQDFLAHELPYGECQGFQAKTKEIINVSDLVRRLTYTREFFVVVESSDPGHILLQMFPEGEVKKNFDYFVKDGFLLLRFITNQYFLEKSQYISKLSRNEEEAKDNVASLLSFLTENLYRIPATETMQVGKRLEDYFAVREEPSLYLTHYMHPYKGKFHPKMVRALLNYAFPKRFGRIMDNFAGSGTLLVEATWMGLDSVGVDINPLSALMCNVKCDSLSFPSEELNREIQNYLQSLLDSLRSFEAQSSGSESLISPSYDLNVVEERKRIVPVKVMTLLKDSKTVDHIIIAHELAKQVKNERARDFILLALSGATSDMARRRKGRFLDVLKDRLKNLYLRIYIFDELNRTLKIQLGKSHTFTADTRNMKNIENESIDAIVNSPPYSTALDYIKNDYPQLTLLELADISPLEAQMIGNPRFKVYSESLLDEIKGRNIDFTSLPRDAKDAISKLVSCGRAKEAMRTYKFFKDMRLAMKEMYRVLKQRSKCVIIIGNNRYKTNGDYAIVKNDAILKEIALEIGFSEDKIIVRELEKSQEGMIRHESILVLEKPALE